jgi:hypothetical protein
VEALGSSSAPGLEAVWSELPEAVAVEENSLKFDAYLTARPGRGAWGLAWNDRFGNAEQDRARLKRILLNYDWEQAEWFCRQVPGVQTLALGWAGGKTRVKLYRQEDPWGTGLEGPLGRGGRLAGALAERLGIVCPDWLVEEKELGVLTLELLEGGGCTLKSYLGAESAVAFREQAPLLVQAMEECCPKEGWYYLTIRLDPGGQRLAVNKIYNTVQLGFTERFSGEPDLLSWVWAEIRALFGQAGQEEALEPILRFIRENPDIRVVPTATAVEEGGRSVDLYCAAWEF